jgi:hypothetical protein
MNICECPNPPGGRVKCNDDQLAICLVRPDGTTDAICAERPRTTNVNVLENWILGLVIGVERSPTAPISGFDRLVLNDGRFVRDDGTRVTFRIPRDDHWPTGGGSSSGSPGGFGSFEQQGRTRLAEGH